MAKWAGDLLKSIAAGLLVAAILAAPGYLIWFEGLPLFLIPLSILLSVGLILFIMNQRRMWKKGKGISKLSDKKIEKTIRDWLDIPGVSIQRQEAKPQLYFNYLMTYKEGLRLNIFREKQNPAVIQIVARVKASLLDIPFDEVVLKKNGGRVGIEMARLGIEYKWDGAPNPHEFILLMDPVILDASLTEYRFRQRVLFVLRAMILVLETSKQTADELGLRPVSLQEV